MTLSSLYSAFLIKPEWDVPVNWRLFSYSRSQSIPGTGGTPLVAQKAHTNIPRSGESGLPMEWDAVIDRWRAVTSIRFAEPVLEWASQSEATLRYNARVVDSRPLLDLLFSSQGLFSGEQWDTSARSGSQVRTREPRMPLHIRENISYGVEVQSNPGAAQKLQRWLVEHTSDYQLITWIFLEGIVRPGAR